MLRPPTVAAGNYPIATKPLLGYEQQLYVTTQPYTDLGLLQVLAVNSGTYTANTADNTRLATVPQELLLIAETGVLGDSALTVQVVGTDALGAALSGVATFTPPGYAQDQGFDLHQHRAVEVIPWQAGVVADGSKFKTITAVTPLAASAAYTNAKFRLVGMPSVLAYAGVPSPFVKIGTKTSLEFEEKIQEPVAIQDGVDAGAYIKPGIIPVGTLSISTKDPVSADGLRRYNGLALTGLIKEVKQDLLATQYVFLGGLIITVKPKGGEGQEAVSLDASAMYQRVGCVLAQ